ncbi:hypothetical protein A167_00053 [Alcanivorax sp. S71-1-4]|nr:hypothetical protein A167_00053 [Alcanivorax sp. S71-1-4]
MKLLQNSAYVSWGDIGDGVVADEGVDLLPVDALGYLGIFEASGQVVVEPVLEELLNGIEFRQCELCFLADRVGAGAQALFGHDGLFPGRGEAHLRISAQRYLMSFALAAIAKHPVGDAGFADAEIEAATIRIFLGGLVGK